MEVLKKISVRSCSAFNRAAYIQPCSESSDAQGLILHHHSQVQLGSNTLQRLLYVYVFLGMIWMNIGGLMSKGCPK